MEQTNPTRRSVLRTAALATTALTVPFARALPVPPTQSRRVAA